MSDEDVQPVAPPVMPERAPDFVTVTMPDGTLQEMSPAVAQAYLAMKVKADNAERRAGAGEVSAPALKKELSIAEQAEKLGLHRSADTQDCGADAYSSTLSWEGKTIFMLEMDPETVAAFEAEGKAIDEDFKLALDPDANLTPEDIERINTVPARRMGFNEKIILHCSRGCLQMHPFDAERQKRLWPSQKMDLANAMLTRSRLGYDFLSLS